ncbi:tRNA lysidine(34) synthetase TilS [Paraglaciecola marina]|uniref:tRNA lysidine(34) synthetase TilS n=1 Tax=Paraglaciecola marina TaxID=2500157 RepID=UPI00105B9E0B|nr:tRNA lysidine(34) synthetase TilS [Paraglaciecola marina]
MSLLTTLNVHLSVSPLSEANDIVVAYSGGVDSHVLLHALSELKQHQANSFNLHAIHIHHGLNQNANMWQEHCRAVCLELGVSFQTANVAVNAQARQSLEAQARDARYQKLVEMAPADSQILLGQHQDDQLETFLLQLKRGAGPKGLSAMNQQWSVTNTSGAELKIVNFYRPLLEISQKDILEYAQQQKLKWVEDESNQDAQFDRNFLRLDVLPILQNRWPELASSVSRSAQLCAQQQKMLDEICAEKLAIIQSSKSSLDLNELLKLSEKWLHQLVRYWLSQQGIASPSLAVLQQLLPQVLLAAEDANPILQWQTWQFRRFNQQLYVIPVPIELPEFEKLWQGESGMVLPENLGCLCFTQDNNELDTNQVFLAINPDLGPLTVRLGGYSAKFKPKGSQYSKPIKQWFKLWKVPPWIRDNTLIIIQNQDVIGLIGEGKCYQAAVKLNQVRPIFISLQK